MTEIPLFPLGAVLMPYGHMPLQIFEQRYIDLVADCMRENTGFGVAWLRRGAETGGPEHALPLVGDYGTYARIVDWDQLPNGLLGITVRGEARFDVGELRRADNGLVMAEVQLAPAIDAAPMQPRWASLVDVLRGLEAHPHVQRMNLNVDYDNAWDVVGTLVQLLPFEESIKYELQGMADIATVAEELDTLLNQISGED